MNLPCAKLDNPNRIWKASAKSNFAFRLLDKRKEVVIMIVDLFITILVLSIISCSSNSSVVNIVIITVLILLL